VLLVSVLALFLAGDPLPREREALPQDPPPSFVVLLADDLGWTDLACTGSRFHHTPNLDRLRWEGMLLTDGYAAAPVCSPTRSSILTGRYPARTGNTEWFGGRRSGRLLTAEYVDHLPLEEFTLAEALGAAGWRTAFLGKWHLGGEGYEPERQGFELNLGGNRYGNPGTYWWPWKVRGRQVPHLAARGQEGEHLTERLGLEAAAWIREHAGEPFLLYLSFYAVHTPIEAPPDRVARYEAKRHALGIPDARRWGREGERRVRLVQDHAAYAALVETLDRSVGRVLDALDETGAAGNTLVVFLSDNGGLSTSEGHPTSNLPLRAGKGWLYEGGIRVPWIVRWPGRVAPGSTSREPVITTDLYPTFLEAAGLPLRPQQHRDGRSLLPVLLGTGGLDREALFWHYPHYSNQGGGPASAVRFGTWKLLEDLEDGHLELYDLATDPGERRDLSGERPELAATLRARLQGFREETGARYPRPRPAKEEKR